MAVTYISTNTSKRLGADLRQAVHALKEVRSDLRELKAVMETMIDGADYSLLETEFGLPVGLGDDTYNLVSGALADMEGANVNQTVIRLG